MNRPIVVTPGGIKLCRPSEAVLDILPNPNIAGFVKEDGEVVEDVQSASERAQATSAVGRNQSNRFGFDPNSSP